MRACCYGLILLAGGLLAGCSGSTAQQEDATRVDTDFSGLTFGYEAYNALLAAHVDDRGFVDYAALKEQREPLDRFVASMDTVTPSELAAWSEPDRIAFWINAYNAITLQYIIDHYPIQKRGLIAGALYPANSIRQIPGVWDKLKSPVAGEPITLDAIEHQILRVEFNEPRIHMAIVCASVGCPPLRDEAFIGEKLDAQLDEQSRKFIEHPDRFRIDYDRNVVYLSPIFDWFGKDWISRYTPQSGFDGHKEPLRAVLHFVSNYVSDADAEYLKQGDYSVKFTDYDWSLNEQ